MPYLIMSENSKDYKVLRFINDISIGRAATCDIVLDNIEVSRHHAHIAQEDGVFILFDQSANGTLVDDVPVERHYLSHGIVFQILDYLFTFIDESSTVNVAGKSSICNKLLSKSESGIGDVTRVIPGRKVGDEDTVLKESLLREGIIVESEPMLKLYRDIQVVAGIHVPVLILGEAGTGKEHVAHALHNFSKVKGNFIPLNCSSIPEGLFESELFGCVKGAFSNATDKPGKLELAINGTIFLDEIGDMSLSLQPKLLRFIEDKLVTRLGDTRVGEVNSRVVAATNQNLLEMIQGSTFREDFYQRLACIKLEVPPLRERQDDIPSLVEFFISRFSEEYDWKPSSLSANALKILKEYHWPGNIRELKNVLLNAMVHVQGKGKTIYPKDLAAVSKDLSSFSNPPDKSMLSLDEMEKKHIDDVLGRVGWNKTEASGILGISRDTLYKKMAKYGIKKS